VIAWRRVDPLRAPLSSAPFSYRLDVMNAAVIAL
jgi:hypothetical protein